MAGSTSKRVRSGSKTATRKPRANSPRGKQRPTSGKKPASSRRRSRSRRSWRMPLGRSAQRIRVFVVFLTALLVLVLGRAVQLQVIDSTAFAAEAAKRMSRSQEIAPVRGTIYDRNGAVLAETEPAVIVSIDPDMVLTNGADKRRAMTEDEQQEAEAAPDAVAAILAKHLGGKPETYRRLIDADPKSRYQIVARQVPAAVFADIRADMRKGYDGDGKRPWHGVFSEPDPIRTYPNRSLASGVVGFTNGEGKGVLGIERAYNQELTGEPGLMIYERSRYGRIPLGTNVMEPAVDGMDYTLTIDSDLEWATEQFLAEGMRNSGAKTGMAIVMNVDNGEILAMANAPGFDASQPGDAAPADLSNRTVAATYEPGSVQKVLTMAALADAGLVTPDTKVVVPERIASGGGYVRDAFSHGTLQLTARGVLTHSSNIGTIQLARQLSKADLANYLSDFGLGTPTACGLPAEASGKLPKADMADYTRDQISFGQGLSVTAVQMAGAVSAVVNGGTWHQPHLIKAVTNPDGSQELVDEVASRQVISPEASAAVVDMMEAVIAQGSGDRTIPGYRTIGKSGTAQRYDPNCKCYNGYTASFVAAAPAEDPKLLVYVVLDQPTHGNSGSVLALPVANKILQVALPRYNVLPSTSEAPNGPLTFE